MFGLENALCEIGVIEFGLDRDRDEGSGLELC